MPSQYLNQFSLGLVIAAVFLLGCSPEVNTPERPVHMKDLPFTYTEVSPWIQDTIRLFPDSVSLQLVFNGMVPKFAALGLDTTIVQNLINTSAADTLFCEIWIMKMGCPTKAKAIYDTIKTTATDLKPAPSFPDTSIAVIDDGSLDGNTTFAHFRQFYLQLQFSGYVDETLAISAADRFLKAFAAKFAANR